MSGERNIRLTLAFDGAGYHGWQIQKERATVQGTVRDAIARVTGEAVQLVGSGRTDSGTHARALVASFRTRARLAPGALARALNSVLPRDVRVLGARRVPLEFHAQRSARSKVYRYQIYRGKVCPPHLAREHYLYSFPIDLEQMRQGAALLVGRHDFASFARTHAPGEGPATTVRTVLRAELAERGRRLLFTAEADGFLHHMVRNMVGTLLELGRGRMTLEEVERLFERRDRRLAGFTAPAHGLILMRVRY